MSWNDFQAPNLGLLFYRHIYQQQDVTRTLKYDDENDQLKFKIEKDTKPNPFAPYYNSFRNFEGNKYRQIINPVAAQRFHLYTTYPGLLTGSGYMHDTGALGDFKIGCFFDHTTGQPVIPGSSVKGLLKSVFEADVKEVNGKLVAYTGSQSVAAVQFMFSEMNIQPPAFTIDDLKIVTKEIFGNEDKPGKDIFFDAVPLIHECRSNAFMDIDFITPHKNPLKNPEPLQFLKVLPNVAFEFRFKLSNTNDTWTEDFKVNLFKQILRTLGIGAKTNTGYGHFAEQPLLNNFTKEKIETQTVKQPAPEPPPKNAAEENTDIIPDALFNQLKNGKTFPGVIVEVTEARVYAEFTIKSHTMGIYKRRDKVEGAAVGKIVNLKVNRDYVVTEPLNCKFIVQPS